MDTLKEIFERRHKNKEQLIAKYGADFADETYVFNLNKAEMGVVNEWLASLKDEIVDIQVQDGVEEVIQTGEPYYGAIDSGVTYTFTPTGLGDILVVKEPITGKELNVTEALDWYFFG